MEDEQERKRRRLELEREGGVQGGHVSPPLREGGVQGGHVSPPLREEGVQGGHASQPLGEEGVQGGHASQPLGEEGVQGGLVSPPLRADDKDGHYVFDLGENLTRRYKILSKLGEGSFGKVVECLDGETGEHVAVKIVQNLCESRDVAMLEIRTLKYIVEKEIGKSHFVQIKSSFDYRNHTCIVFEKLGPSLSDFLERNSYNPFPMKDVTELARQLLKSVAYFHDLHRIHTDLKPQNILFVSDDYVKPSAIKLIDFGLTAHGDKNHNHMIQSRPYRAPEVILGIEWCYPCDLWSIGCILLELISGKMLFVAHDSLEHLAMMKKVLGPLPEHMVQRATTKKFFKNGKYGLRLNWPAGAVSKERSEEISKFKPLWNLVVGYVGSTIRTGHLAELLLGLLKLDPSERLTARKALDSPFFKLLM